MSAPDFIARGLAAGARASDPATFASLEQRFVPLSVERLHTSGYSQSGIGAGSYVSDALCTGSLAAEHPRFVFRTANNRLFRLMPEKGAILVEQGGAVGDGVGNDQPAIQAAIDYAAAVGIGEVAFASEHYAIFAVPRTTPKSDQFAVDGHPIVLTATVSLRGVAPRRSLLDFKGIDGADPNADFQIVPADASADAAAAVWRGGGIFVRGDFGWHGPPPELAIDAVQLHRLILQGNRSRTDPAGWPESNWPADPVTGDGWDDTDRPFWIQDTHVGDVELYDCDMIGWRGELYYGAALTQRSLRMERVKLAHTNANALNPSTNCPIVARDCEFGDAFQAHEDTGKVRAIYNGCRWYDSGRLNIGSGPANGLSYNYLYPTRGEADNPPVTRLEACSFENVGAAHVGCWVRGKVKTVDTPIYLTTWMYSDLRDIELEIDAWLDRKTAIEPLVIEGPDALDTQVAGAPEGVYQREPRNMRLVVRAMLTELAKRSNRMWSPATWSGYVNSNVALILEDCIMQYAPLGRGTAVSMPLIEMRNFRHEDTDNNPVDGARYVGDISSSITIQPAGPLLCYSFSAGRHAVSMAGTPPGGVDYGYAHGQVLKIYSVSNAANEGDGILLSKQDPWNRLRLKESRLLSRAGDCIELRFNKHYLVWEEIGFRTSAMTELSSRQAAVAIPALSAGATISIPLALAGARPGDPVVASVLAAPAGLMISANATTDQAHVVLFNPTDTDMGEMQSDIALRIRR